MGNQQTEVLVIGGSNLRKYSPSQIPSHWSVVSIPGADLKLINDILVKRTPNILSSLRHVIVAVGINDRDKTTRVPIRDCLCSAKYFIGTGGSVHFQGIPVNTDAFGETQIKRLEYINTNAKEMLMKNYIAPPMIFSTAPNGVHYKDETLTKILNNMINHISHLN